MRVDCKLCHWSYPCSSVEHGVFLLSAHLRGKHQTESVSTASVNECLAAMSQFPWAVQEDAARHILGHDRRGE